MPDGHPVRTTGCSFHRVAVASAFGRWTDLGASGQPAPSERFCTSVAHSIRRVEHQDSSRERNRNGHQRWLEQVRHRPFSSGSCIAATASTVRPNTTGSASAIRNGSGSLCGVAARCEPPSRTRATASWLTFVPEAPPTPPDPPGCSSSNTVPSSNRTCWRAGHGRYAGQGVIRPHVRTLFKFVQTG